MDAALREERAGQCEAFAGQIHAMFEESHWPDPIAKWLNPIRGKHWFISTDFNDPEWTIGNINRTITDPRLRFEMSKKFPYLQGKQGSFCHRPQNKGHHVHFIDIRHEPGADMMEVMFHEFMHGLRSDNAIPQTIREELATDTFSVLAMKKLGFEPIDIYKQLFPRLKLAEPDDHHYATCTLPDNYPSLAFIPEIEKLAKHITPSTSLREIYALTNHFVAHSDPKKFKAWHRFCVKAHTMLREGETMPTIIKEASTCRADEEVRHIGMTLFWLMPFTERTRIAAPHCNAFVEDERFLAAHRNAQMDAFNNALENAVRQKSSRPFLEAAALQIGDLWQGKSFGYAADALASAAVRWYPGIPRSEMQHSFDARMDSSRHDSYETVSELGRSYAFSLYRNAAYREMDREQRIDYERKHARETTMDHTANLICEPLLILQSHAPELIPDPLTLQPQSHKPLHIVR